ncbi:MAG TPA: hypothetical protein PK406_00770 [Verrucomicrobiota bacterium]|nr:hypothetical protein [Verrucomicrobiota bacterium]
MRYALMYMPEEVVGFTPYMKAKWVASRLRRLADEFDFVADEQMDDTIYDRTYQEGPRRDCKEEK